MFLGWSLFAHKSYLPRWSLASFLCSPISTCISVRLYTHHNNTCPLNDGVPPPLCPLYLSGFPDYGFYSGPGDQRAAPCSFADYATLGPHTGQMLQSEHVTSTCNSPSQHHPSPDHFKSSGVYCALLDLLWYTPLEHVSNKTSSLHTVQYEHLFYFFKENVLLCIHSCCNKITSSWCMLITLKWTIEFQQMKQM